MARIGDNLGGIKEIVQFNKSSHGGQTMEIKIVDVEWLIEKAEKVERYEKALKRIAYCEFDGWSGSDVLGKVTDFANETLKN
jgi:hypothetical protein